MTGNLQLGWYLDHPDRVVEIVPKDIAQHTAVLAQSGAGKSFFLGRLVEEILLKTKARVIVLDANGDFRKVDETDSKAWDKAEAGAQRRLPEEDYAKMSCFAADWRGKVRKVHLRNTPGSPEERQDVHIDTLRFPWHKLGPLQAGAALGLDPRHESTELHLLNHVLEDCRPKAKDGNDARFYVIEDCPEQVMPTVERLEESRPKACFEAAGHRLLAALWAVRRWEFWPRTEEEAQLKSYVYRDDWELLVFDLPSAGEPRAQLFLASFVLDEVWQWAREQWEGAAARRQCDPKARDERVPTLIVIDEAHNFAPQQTTDLLAENVASSIHRIAADGRKYGLFLLLATQRPAKVREGLLAECENVCLLRLQSPVDHRTAADTWGVPLEEVARTRHFKTGDGLLFGRWVPSATVFHAARRRTKEGGASLDPDHWAQARIEVDDRDSDASDEP